MSHDGNERDFDTSYQASPPNDFLYMNDRVRDVIHDCPRLAFRVVEAMAAKAKAYPSECEDRRIGAYNRYFVSAETSRSFAKSVTTLHQRLEGGQEGGREGTKAPRAPPRGARGRQKRVPSVCFARAPSATEVIQLERNVKPIKLYKERGTEN